ncbi:MAG: GNAT family N-acetyltransferase [Desulfocapsaceae bacterium]|nr:GNAT family N-acetyltransferase [Desulfocapsaceae bacterium]
MNPNKTSVFIRKMRRDDIKDIERIYTLITNNKVRANFSELVENPSEQREAKSTCFVAELEGKVVGFMINHVMTFSFGLEKSAWMAALGVDPKHMGQQIGARLAAEIFEYYKTLGITRIYTSVQWDSTDIVSFFKTLGFHRSDFINLERIL